MVSTFEFADNVVGIIVDSSLDEELMEKLQRQIYRKFEIHDEINLFFEIKEGNKMTFRAFLDQMKFNVKYDKKFNKVALVTDHKWLHNSMAVKDLLMTAEIKSFTNKERMEALFWISH